MLVSRHFNALVGSVEPLKVAHKNEAPVASASTCPLFVARDLSTGSASDPGHARDQNFAAGVGHAAFSIWFRGADTMEVKSGPPMVAAFYS